MWENGSLTHETTTHSECVNDAFNLSSNLCFSLWIEPRPALSCSVTTTAVNSQEFLIKFKLTKNFQSDFEFFIFNLRVRVQCFFLNSCQVQAFFINLGKVQNSITNSSSSSSVSSSNHDYKKYTAYDYLTPWCGQSQVQC